MTTLPSVAPQTIVLLSSEYAMLFIAQEHTLTEASNFPLVSHIDTFPMESHTPNELVPIGQMSLMTVASLIDSLKLSVLRMLIFLSPATLSTHTSPLPVPATAILFPTQARLVVLLCLPSSTLLLKIRSPLSSTS